ncbi:MAG: hypothetical protein QNJ74_08725 [Trichodesmium sp. MO_231.B1]|nr:hypothetical protein [Trichodesmium sp. MO_231.B1]
MILEVDLKVKSIRQPQSSCPFRDASNFSYHLSVISYQLSVPRSYCQRLEILNRIFLSSPCRATARGVAKGKLETLFFGQKVYGLGYHLLVFVYEKIDNHELRATSLNFQNAIFVGKERTGDYQTTRGLIDIISRNGNQDDVIGFLEDRNLPLDEIGREVLAERIIRQPPQQGYITISNAWQWRLQYRRIIEQAVIGITVGVENILG